MTGAWPLRERLTTHLPAAGVSAIDFTEEQIVAATETLGNSGVVQHGRSAEVIRCAALAVLEAGLGMSELSSQITTDGHTMVDSPGTGCLEPGSVHLLMADTALAEPHRCRCFLALCGAELTAERLPPWDCPEGCGCDFGTLICPDCVRQAAELSVR